MGQHIEIGEDSMKHTSGEEYPKKEIGTETEESRKMRVRPRVP